MPIADYLKPLFEEKWHTGQHEPYPIDAGRRWTACHCDNGRHRFAFTIQDHDGTPLRREHDEPCVACGGRGWHPALQEVNIAAQAIAVHDVQPGGAVDFAPIVAQLESAVAAGRSDLEPLLEQARRATAGSQQHGTYLHNLHIWRLLSEDEARELLAERRVNYERQYADQAQRAYLEAIVRTSSDAVAVARAHLMLLRGVQSPTPPSQEAP